MLTSIDTFTSRLLAFAIVQVAPAQVALLIFSRYPRLRRRFNSFLAFELHFVYAGLVLDDLKAAEDATIAQTAHISLPIPACCIRASTRANDREMSGYHCSVSSNQHIAH